MNTALRVGKSCWSQMALAFLIPVFFFTFITVYAPFSFQEFFDIGGKSWTFHLLMLSCIMIGVLAITRLIFFICYKYVSFLWWHYVLWCMGEALITSFFFALYTSLFHINEGGLPYFSALHYCLKICFMVLIYPYLFYILGTIIINKKKDILEAGKTPDEPLMKLYDEHKRLKMTIDPSAIVYVSAESNYIDIHFMDNDRVKSYLLRNSMKSFDEAASAHGIVRCHRSFFVNPKYIKVLSRGKEGLITIEFNETSLPKIPVSKMYYDSLVKSL